MNARLQKLKDQRKGVCTLCERKVKETLHCDHCHKEERARGFLIFDLTSDAAIFDLTSDAAI